ncbi:phosphopantetheine-binding protein, partial [Aquimarina algiphila]|uniref:phosphopantetheine-binding protein n=1 Tax=Aquimarina algiphila TaxID=2047982 RepID=UPI00232A977E
WEEVLGREGIGVKDDFFELGGHSLKALIVLSKIKSKMRVQINIEYFFMNASIEKIAIQINFLLKQEEIKLNKDKLKERFEL